MVFHSLLTPGAQRRAARTRGECWTGAPAGAEGDDVPLASLEGFVRQVIGWREYMRATYLLWGRRMRSRNRLGHTRPLAPGWWDADDRAGARGPGARAGCWSTATPTTSSG